ncbi:MAG: hypothetical protein VX265_05345 [Myxococcota bacterium]|nr:hypothetical protein [Myxococcota bacterium]
MSTLLPALMLTAAAAVPASAYRAALATDAGWQEVAVKKHASVGEVRVRHKKVAGLDCLEGIAHTTASVEKLLSAARDIDGSRTWSSAKLLDSKALTSGVRFDYFQVLDNPFPIKDRYWFLRGETVRAGDTASFEWHHIDPAAQHPAVYARVVQDHPDAISTGVNVGAWVFTQVEGKVRVHYRLCSDPGGSIPDWAGHKAAEMSLPTNIADIIERARGQR